jgi:hypothetical protein
MIKITRKRYFQLLLAIMLFWPSLALLDYVVFHQIMKLPGSWWTWVLPSFLETAMFAIGFVVGCVVQGTNFFEEGF